MLHKHIDIAMRANFSKVSNFMHILYVNLLIFEKFAHIAIGIGNLKGGYSLQVTFKLFKNNFFESVKTRENYSF
jgi:hypothetical protein